MNIIRSLAFGVRRKKRRKGVEVCAVLILYFIGVMSSSLPAYAAGVEVSATSGLVMDTVTGRVIYEKNGYQKRSMASTTKIMTAILALEKGNPEDVVTTSRKAAHVEGSSMWLEEGEKQRLEDLLYGLMLTSGNDAAIAVAEHIGGSVEAFADMMTQKAREIGAMNTSFKNPHGLDADGHYTTAYDLALITRYALQNERFAGIVKTKKKKIPWPGHQWDRVFKNGNRLLEMYEGCDGVKTGYTKRTGRCLVSSATKNGWQAVAVTLTAPNDWEDHKKMLDFAFEHYQVETIIEKGEFMKTLPVTEGKEERVHLVAASGLTIPMKKGDRDTMRIEYDVPYFTPAPVHYNQELGNIRLYINDVECGTVALVANDFVERKDIKLAYERIIKNWLMIFRNNGKGGGGIVDNE